MLNGAEQSPFIGVIWGSIRLGINKREPQTLATKKMDGNNMRKKTTYALIRDLNHNNRLLDQMKREGMDKVSDTTIVERGITAIIAEIYIRGC